MTTCCDDPQCPIIDEPFWSGERLFFGLGRWLEDRAVYDDYSKHNLLYRLRWHRRYHAKEAHKRIRTGDREEWT